MNHLENLEKLRDALKEKLAETNDLADYEAQNGSIGAAENLKDECKRLNQSIDSIEWVIGVADSLTETKDDYIRKLESVSQLAANETWETGIVRLTAKKMCYRQIVSELQRILNP